VSHPIQARALHHLHQRPRLRSLLSETSSPRRLGAARVLPSSLWRFLVENQLDHGGDLGGLGLKETQSFVDSSTET
jgi:hypothetical protein